MITLHSFFHSTNIFIVYLFIIVINLLLFLNHTNTNVHSDTHNCLCVFTALGSQRIYIFNKESNEKNVSIKIALFF